MIDVQGKKRKIVSFLSENGPSLPVRIARVIEMTPIFASAILSEMLGERSVKTSNLRVGSSPLYLLPGQEVRLEEHIDNLKLVEKEAYLKLKEKKVLLDENEPPVVRVALQGLKDFAVQLNDNGKIVWKYAFITDEEAENIINKKQKKEVQKIEEPIIEELKEEPPKKEKAEKKEKPKKKVEKTEEKDPAEFISEVKEFLNEKKVDLVKEIEVSKKEVIATIKLKTSLGDLELLLVAKNKKSATEEEINQALQRASHEQMPCLLVIRKEPTKKVQSIIGTNKLIRIETMK